MSRKSVYKKGEGRLHLFYETSHSPSLIELVGVEESRKITDFCFIANHYYPTPAMMRQMQHRFADLVKSYPGSRRGQGEKYLSKVIKVKSSQLLVGNGAAEIIALVMDHFLTRIAVPVPTFSEYVQHLRDRAAAELYYVPADQDYQLNLNEYAAWIKKKKLKAALLINPNNPTGQTFSIPALKQFLKKTRHLNLVIIDESFIDFAGTPVPSLLPYMKAFKNLLIIRSMSKHCGIPGLRLGYAASGNEKIIKKLRSYMAVWNVNTLAEYFLSLLPPTAKAYETARKKVIADTQWLIKELNKNTALKVYPSGANFILLRVPHQTNARALQLKLLHTHRMYVRDCTNKIGLDASHIRIATQGRIKDKKLLAAMKKIFKDQRHV